MTLVIFLNYWTQMQLFTEFTYKMYILVGIRAIQSETIAK
jgi:hypothetical protein